jgi:hypothetical protein
MQVQQAGTKTQTGTVTMRIGIEHSLKRLGRFAPAAQMM